MIAAALMPLGLLLFRWCGRKIRDAVRKLPDNRFRKILLFTFYGNDDKFDTDIDPKKILPNTRVWPP